ncbi:TolC family protein [Vibrio rotiferianus]|uniref:TolC family protein n=1 Tax=Vibrio rotiferianus TaxID=190895 RepID=UPI00406A1FC7
MKGVIYFAVFLCVGCSSSQEVFKDYKDHKEAIDKLKVESSRYRELANRPTLSYMQYVNHDELGTLIDSAFSSNNRINDARYRINLAKVNANITEAVNDPIFGAGLGYTVSDEITKGSSSTETLNANITVSYEFDLWGKYTNLEKISLVDLSQAQLNFEKVTKEVVYEVTSLYIESAIDQKMKTLLLQSLDIVKNQLISMESNFSNGYISESELLSYKNNLSLHYEMLNDINLSMLIKRSQIENITGYKGGLSFSIEENQYENGLFSLVDFETSIFLNVNVAIALLGELKVKLESEYEILQFYPQLNVNANIVSTSDDLQKLFDNPIGTLASGLLFPILNYNKISLVMERADVEYLIEVNHVLNIIRDVQFEHVEKMNSLKKYNVKHTIRRKIKSVSEKKLSHSFSRLRAGEISQIEYFESVLESYRDEQEYLEFIKQKLLIQSELFIFFGDWTLLPNSMN